MPDPTISNISDTARWVAMYRAIETERPDARFRDPYARRLAGARGEQIAKEMPKFRSGVWPMVVRTCVFDELVLRAIERDGADTVVNLAAGLDARPWRLKLPPALRWIDADLPQILAYKTESLSTETPACAYEAVSIDLADAGARRTLFERIGRASKKTVILTEGLLVYLTPEQVGALATDLHTPDSFRWWVIDIASPKLLGMLEKNWGRTLAQGRARLQFGPAEGTRFFEPFGWKEAEFHSTWEESKRLDRQMTLAWLWNFIGRFAPAERREEWRRMGGIVLLERR